MSARRHPRLVITSAARTRDRLARLVTALAIASACSSPEDNAPDKDGGEDTPGPPPAAPQAITFRDQDPRQGFTEGEATLTPPASLDRVAAYRIYFTDRDGKRLGVAADVPAEAAKYTFSFGTSVPEGMYLIAAVSVASDGVESEASVSTRGDNFSEWKDLGVDTGVDELASVTPLIDTVNQKLLFVAVSPVSTETAVRRCALDGTACEHHTIWSPPTPNFDSSARVARAVLDTANQRLLIVRGAIQTEKPTLHRCALDATACSDLDISAGFSAPDGDRYLGTASDIAIDEANKKLLFLVYRQSGASSLFRCSVDGTACTHSSLPTNAATSDSRARPRIHVDATNQKLLVVVGTTSGNQHLGMLRCDLDGTSCTAKDLVTAAGLTMPPGGFSDSLTTSVIDVVNQKLLVATNSGHLFRCAIDGATCTTASVIAGRSVSGAGSMAIDLTMPASPKLLVLTGAVALGSSEYSLSMSRCSLDGTGCANADIFPGGKFSTAGALVMDGARGRLLVAGLGTKTGQAVFLRCGVDGAACGATTLRAPMRGAKSGQYATAFLDGDAGKLLTIAVNGPGYALYRCDRDGANCTYADLTPDATATTEFPAYGGRGGVFFDPSTKTIVIVTFVNRGAGSSPVVIRCHADGSGCTSTPMPIDTYTSTPYVMRSAFDAKHQKLLVCGVDAAMQSSTFRCSADGSGCVKTPTSKSCTLSQASAIDVKRDKLFFVSTDNKLVVTMCEVDGTACVDKDLSSVAGTQPLSTPRLFVDDVHDKLWIAAARGTGGLLLGCAADATACSAHDGLRGLLDQSPMSIGLDASGSRVLLTTDGPLGVSALNMAQRHGPSLTYCPVDGGTCLTADVSSGQSSFGYGVSAFVKDTAARKLVFMGAPGTNLTRPTLFSFDDW